MCTKCVIKLKEPVILEPKPAGREYVPSNPDDIAAAWSARMYDGEKPAQIAAAEGCFQD